MSSKYERAKQTQFVELDGERMIIHTGNCTISRLNEVGGFVWECLATPRDLEQLTDAACARYGVDRETFREDVVPFLENLQQIGVVAATLRVGD